MFELKELLRTAQSFEDEIKELNILLGIDAARANLEEYAIRLEDPNFWNDLESLKTLNILRQKIENFEKLSNSILEVIDFITISILEEDNSMYDSLVEKCDEIKAKIDSLKLDSMFSGEYDNSDVILTIHAGAGGREAQDWASMLYRMYNLWLTKNGYNFKEIDFIDGDGPGLVKSVTLLIEGEYAYGKLKSEHGVHRLIRVSPFDSSNRRHTSFAAIEVLPQIKQDLSLEINPDDLKVDTYRSSGAGGQHVNKTSSAVRITHLPTGIVAACQTQRSQFQNKDYAMKMLCAKLTQLKEQEHLEKISDLKGKQNAIEWGSQIRSYTFMPYQLVKDHRSNFEDANINKVMNGGIDDFILEYHKSLNKQTD